MTRLTVTTSLRAARLKTHSIFAFRSGRPASIANCYAARACPRPRGVARIGRAHSRGAGAPYALAVALGLRFAPAYDAGALNPGCMPLFVALIATTVLGETPSKAQKIGLWVILAGAIITLGCRSTAWGSSRAFGDALFLVASFLTVCYTVIMRWSKLDAVHVAALVSTGSLVIYAPFYVALNGHHLAEVRLASLAAQAIFQGLVVRSSHMSFMVAQFSFWGLRVARLSAHWCRHCRGCSLYRSRGSRQRHQVGAASVSGKRGTAPSC
jgi:drug/metabolite transporter (DMT)-like permease